MRYLLVFLHCFLFSNVLFPQEPIILKTVNGDMHGTLLVPSQNVPVVLIIAGSGATDRDCNQGDKKTNAYKMFAGELAASNIASLRFDKRGVGQSDAGISSENELNIETYINDVKAWVDMISKDKRFSTVYLAGHSEGSLIGILAAINNDKVKGLISIAGAGRPADVILKEQLSHIHEPVKVIMFGMIDALKKGDTISNVPPIYYSLFRPSVQPYMISWFKYDPAVEIKQLKQPVLIIHGLTDIQVKETDARLLAEALPSARLKLVKNMNHVLKNCDSLDKKFQLPVYEDPLLPLHKEFTPAAVEFIKEISAIKKTTIQPLKK